MNNKPGHMGTVFTHCCCFEATKKARETGPPRNLNPKKQNTGRTQRTKNKTNKNTKKPELPSKSNKTSINQTPSRTLRKQLGLGILSFGSSGPFSDTQVVDSRPWLLYHNEEPFSRFFGDSGNRPIPQIDSYDNFYPPPQAVPTATVPQFCFQVLSCPLHYPNYAFDPNYAFHSSWCRLCF